MSASAAPRTLVELYARSAAAHPDRIAVSDEDGNAFTYAELHARARALARALRRRGVGADDVVAVHMQRGAGVVVALLAVCEAGAAYVAIDVRYPEAIRDHMLRDSGARVVVTQPDWTERLAALGDLDVLSWQDGEDGDDPALAPPQPGNAACVLYTSGSTGLPKGIVLQHDQLLCFVTNPTLPRMVPEDRTAQIASISFDPVNFEVWCTLAVGAQVCVLPSFPELLATDLGRQLRRRGITVMLGPAIGINQAVREDPAAFNALRVLHSGGDVLLPETCRDMLRAGFDGQLCNLYGPAETTTACSQFRVLSPPDELASVPIGTALKGFALHVLDEDLEPVPEGSTGQLYVGGPAVGRGYLGKPGMTAARFVPDPFAGGGRRMYATGDLVRALPGGDLEFLGRVDDQVKIRGYRVELAAVEQTLCLHPEIREATVLAAGEAGQRWLVAFVVAEGDRVSLRSLRVFLEERLPEYMVPADYVRLRALPTNEHGKRDREALEQMIESRTQQRSEYVPPSDAVERYLVGLWEELLTVPDVSVRDDFFTLGGHSLLAFRLHAAIKRDLAIDLEFEKLFESSVLADLAATLRSHGADPVEHEVLS